MVTASAMFVTIVPLSQIQIKRIQTVMVLATLATIVCPSTTRTRRTATTTEGATHAPSQSAPCLILLVTTATATAFLTNVRIQRSFVTMEYSVR